MDFITPNIAVLLAIIFKAFSRVKLSNQNSIIAYLNIRNITVKKEKIQNYWHSLFKLDSIFRQQ